MKAEMPYKWEALCRHLGYITKMKIFLRNGFSSNILVSIKEHNRFISRSN